MFFVPFTRIDKHKKCVTVGSGLFLKEDTGAYTWLLRSFTTAHEKQPTMIVTDQDGAMKLAIKEVLTESKHRLCMWHIMQKILAKKNKVAYEENIAILEFEVKDKEYGDQLSESDSEVLRSVFDSRSSDGDDNPTNDRFKKGDGYHAVPPPLTENYMPPLADLSFARLDDSVYRPTTNKASASISKGEPSVIKTSNISVKMPKVNSVRTSGVIIKDWVSDDEDTLVDTQVDSQTTVKPSFKKIEFTKASNESVKSDKQADKPNMVTQNSKADRKDWNGNLTQSPRHMTRNKALLTDYQDIDGGFVAFGGSTKCGASSDRKSTIGGCQFLGSRLISWQCKKQIVVANSTTEAEYIDASHCCGQNPVYHSKTKHIEIRHHFIRDSYEKRLIEMVKTHTDNNVVDLLTKAFDVDDETVHKELGDRMERVVTTASSLEAERDSVKNGLKKHVSSDCKDRHLGKFKRGQDTKGIGSGSGPRSQDIILGLYVLKLGHVSSNQLLDT
nr:putative ribonuclease H-like domain-containing protein [Tanacetum cinerariifolium]